VHENKNEKKKITLMYIIIERTTQVRHGSGSGVVAVRLANRGGEE